MIPTIHRVTTLDIVVDDWRWPFADQRRDDIDAHFARQRAGNPALWNGRVFLARDPRVHDDTFSAHAFQTDFASFLAWRDWGFPDSTVINAFGMGALRGSDGGFVLGEMAARTSNAGRIYFPAGTPDLNDINNGRVDIAGSVAREVEEETGLTPSDYMAGDSWYCVSVPAMTALIRVLDMPYPADEICNRIETYLQTQAKPELRAAVVVRHASDIVPAVPSFVAAFIAAYSGNAA